MILEFVCAATRCRKFVYWRVGERRWGGLEGIWGLTKALFRYIIY
jgi:hypothetical protein